MTREKATMRTSVLHTASFFPHDLLWLRDAQALFAAEPMPAWAKATLSRLPVVVVRRAASISADCVSVGLRGSSREQRFAGFTHIRSIRRHVVPEDLVAAPSWQMSGPRAQLPAMQALQGVWARWGRHGPLEQPFVWGPTGSVGFELATGLPTAGPESDLDLVLRAPLAVSKMRAQVLLAYLEGLPARVDVQMETPLGCVVLREYAYSKAPWLLLRTSQGPRPVRNPWSIEKE